MRTSTCLAALALVASPLALGACSSSVVTHGNQLDQQRVAAIRPGVTSREEVARLLGTPSTVATFDDRDWYYISQRYEKMNFFREELVAQDVLKVTFDERGVVSDLEARDIETAMAVDPDPDETRTLGNELSVVQQLLGNLGRFNKEGQGASSATSRRPGGL